MQKGACVVFSHFWAAIYDWCISPLLNMTRMGHTTSFVTKTEKRTLKYLSVNCYLKVKMLPFEIK